MPKFRVAVDAHAIGRRQTGNEVYVRSLIERYPLLAPEIEFVAYACSDEAAEWIPPSFERRTVARNPFIRLGLDLSRKLRQDRADLLHVQYTAPLSCPTPVVVTIHDVSYLDEPQYLPQLRARQLRLTVRRTVERAAKVVTVSEFSRQRIAASYGLDPATIAVTPNAPHGSFRLMNRELAVRQARQRLGLNRPFVLNVGDLHPRKNQIGLIRAFKALLESHPELPHALVLVGKHSWFAPKVMAEVERSGLSDRIVLPKFVEDESLPALYNAADLFVFPSLYEGFGLPVIEAMACGAPVICSNATALPEVVQKAATLVEPTLVPEQMEAMRYVLRNREISDRMRKMSLQRAKCFDWRETARLTLDVYSEVAENGRRRVRSRELVAR